jgi:branched-chain amino acid transport system substrate-binding protein
MKKVFLLILAVIFSHSAFSEERKEIRIGFIAGLSGQYAHISHLMLAGAEDAVQNCNKQLATSNLSLKLIAEDDGLADAKTTLSVVKKFTSIDKVSAILTWVFSTAKPLKSALGAKKTPVLFFWDYNPGIPQLGDNYYGTGPNIKENAKILVKDFITSGASHLGVIMLIDEWAERMKSEIVNALSEHKLTLSTDQSVLFDTSDFKSIIVRAKKSETEGLVILTWGASLITLVNQLREMWPEVKLYTVGQPESDMQLIGESANGMNVINGWIEGALASKLLSAIAKDPLINSKNISPVDLTYAAYGYQSADILCKAISKVVKANQEINDQHLNAALHSIDYDCGLGAVGPGRYSEIHEHMSIWKDGIYVKKSTKPQ